jgi:hypothetical protein
MDIGDAVNKHKSKINYNWLIEVRVNARFEDI